LQLSTKTNNNNDRNPMEGRHLYPLSKTKLISNGKSKKSLLWTSARPKA